MMEKHAEIMDMYQELETKADEIAADLSTVPDQYKLADEYINIDQEIYDIQMWYEKRKKMLEKYMREREEQEEKIKQLTIKMKQLNNSVQNARLENISRTLRQ